MSKFDLIDTIINQHYIQSDNANFDLMIEKEIPLNQIATTNTDQKSITISFEHISKLLLLLSNHIILDTGKIITEYMKPYTLIEYNFNTELFSTNGNMIRVKNVFFSLNGSRNGLYLGLLDDPTEEEKLVETYDDVGFTQSAIGSTNGNIGHMIKEEIELIDYDQSETIEYQTSIQTFLEEEKQRDTLDKYHDIVKSLNLNPKMLLYVKKYKNNKLHCINNVTAEYINGNKEWWQNDKLHRNNNLSAIEYDQYEDYHRKITAWYYKGKLHRENEFAVENIDENETIQEWWQHGLRHNIYGPAYNDIKPDNKYITYWNYGLRHRLDGPTYIIEDQSGKEEKWFKNNRFHRADGPAIIINDNGELRKCWYIDGKRLSKKEFKSLKDK